MRMIKIATYIKSCLWTIKHKGTALLDVHVLLLFSVHTLIQLADMQTHLDKDLERAFVKDLEGPAAFDEKVASN